MRCSAFVLALLLIVSQAHGQDALKIESARKSPPDVAAPIRAVLSEQMYRVSDGQGQVVAEIWPRAGIPAASSPAGPKGTILFPFLSAGELMGVCAFPAEAHDYRDQPIAKGVYTMRYGLQPVNGDHLGVSTHRDYILLLPAAKDRSLDRPGRKKLEEQSAEAAGTSHPAVFLLLAAPEKADPKAAAVIRDAEKNTWSVVLPFQLQIQGASALAFPIRMIILGAAAA